MHGRSGRPCQRCGTIVRVAPIGPPLKERPAFYCPTCQPGPTPTDDGKPRNPLGANPAVPGGSTPHRLPALVGVADDGGAVNVAAESAHSQGEPWGPVAGSG